ncbi:hypothetical protein NFJ02_23g51370 [Pycnococcus provasolii]
MATTRFVHRHGGGAGKLPRLTPRRVRPSLFLHATSTSSSSSSSPSSVESSEGNLETRTRANAHHADGPVRAPAHHHR